MPQNTVTFSTRDFDREIARNSYNIGPLTAANTVAKHAAIDDLREAQEELMATGIHAVNINEQFSYDISQTTDTNCQRENKWLVTYKDVTQFLDVANTINNVGFGNTYSLEIPCAALSLLDPDLHSPFLDLTISPASDYVAAFAAVQNSPTGGNECEVQSIQHVGRSL